MTIEECTKIAYANPTNSYITEHLDDNTLGLVISILEKLDASNFKELNPNAPFDYTDIPIPYQQLQKSQQQTTNFSSTLRKCFDDCLKAINQEQTNVEYTSILKSNENSNKYCKIKPFQKGSTQACSFDWNEIENIIKNSDTSFKLSLLHTHPNPLKDEFNTLYNSNKKVLSELGVKPNGLNVSLADVYSLQYLQMLTEKHNKKIETESTILFYDGTLISFSSQHGIQLTSERNLNLEKNLHNIHDYNSK